jgi:hypothetical protein
MVVWVHVYKVWKKVPMVILSVSLNSIYQLIAVVLFKVQVYTLFTVLKCNLVFVFRCFLHYHFHA